MKNGCLHQREPRFVVGVVYRWCGVAVLFIRDLVQCIVPVHHRDRRIATVGLRVQVATRIIRVAEWATLLLTGPGLTSRVDVVVLEEPGSARCPTTVQAVTIQKFPVEGVC